jgi:hypothetical protein
MNNLSNQQTFVLLKKKIEQVKIEQSTSEGAINNKTKLHNDSQYNSTLVYSPFSSDCAKSRNTHPVSNLEKTLNKYYPLNYKNDSNLNDKDKELYNKITFNKNTYNHLRKLKDFINENKKEIFKLKDKNIILAPFPTTINTPVISSTPPTKLMVQMLNSVDNNVNNNIKNSQSEVINKTQFTSLDSLALIKDAGAYSHTANMVDGASEEQNKNNLIFKLLNKRLKRYIYKYRYKYISSIPNTFGEKANGNFPGIKQRLGLNRHKILYLYLNNELNKYNIAFGAKPHISTTSSLLFPSTSPTSMMLGEGQINISSFDYFSQSYYNHNLIRNILKSNFIVNSWFKAIYDTLPSKYKESNVHLLPYN